MYICEGRGDEVHKIETHILRHCRKVLSLPRCFGYSDMADGYSETISAGGHNLNDLIEMIELARIQLTN